MSRTLSVSLVALGVFSMVACGDDDGPAPVDAAIVDGGPTDAPIAVDAGPDDSGLPDAGSVDAGTSGTLTVEANGVTGASGKIVLAFVTSAGGGASLGGVCAPVTSDPGDVSAIVKTPVAGSDPCTLGANVIFPNGSYNVTAGIYTPGMMMPERCATVTANVVGDTTVTLPTFGACL